MASVSWCTDYRKELIDMWAVSNYYCIIYVSILYIFLPTSTVEFMLNRVM